MPNGQPQMPASGLAVEERLLADGGGAPAALSQDFEGMGTAEMEGVLAVFSGEGIDGLIELPDLLRLQVVLEEGVLDPCVLDEVQKDDPGRPVEVVAPVEVVEKASEEAGPLQRMGRGAGAIRLPACHVEVLLLQKDGEPPGGEAVATGLDAGRLDVPRQGGGEIR